MQLRYFASRPQKVAPTTRSDFAPEETTDSHPAERRVAPESGLATQPLLDAPPVPLPSPSLRSHAPAFSLGLKRPPPEAVQKVEMAAPVEIAAPVETAAPLKIIARVENSAAPSDPAAQAAPDPRKILDSIGEAVYDWNLHSDTISWGPNAANVLGFPNIDAIAAGRGFAECLSHDSESSRYEAIARATGVDDGKGVPFQICYGLVHPDLPREATIWVEDTGRWFAGPDGRPAQAHGIVRVITDRYKQERQLAFKSRFDALTGALNRASLLEQTANFFVQATKRKQSFAALLIGVDSLFALNRTYGYDVADQVITGLAKRLRENCRERDLVARYAGNKFAVVLENCDTSEMTAAAKRFIEVIAGSPFETSAGPVPVSLRIGGVVAPRNGRAVHLLFQHAEEALDLARQPNSPRFIGYEPSLAREDTRMRALKISDEIVSALNEGRIMIALQPLVHAATGVPAFYEALMRLRRPDGALVLPGAILPTAEKAGLIQMIDQRVMELALKKLAEDPAMRIAVNVSGKTLHEPDFFARLRVALGSNPELAQRLTIEFTETCAIEDVEATTRAVAMIKQFGAKVAMDDFGAGHTSFKNLRRFDFDLVKIDGAFVQNLARSVDDRFFVRTLIDLARHVGLPVVAEWVEDEETAKILREWGVEYLQGDFFGAAAVTLEDRRLAGMSAVA